jgi:hypothetical protein
VVFDWQFSVCGAQAPDNCRLVSRGKHPASESHFRADDQISDVIYGSPVVESADIGITAAMAPEADAPAGLRLRAEGPAGRRACRCAFHSREHTDDANGTGEVMPGINRQTLVLHPTMQYVTP